MIDATLILVNYRTAKQLLAALKHLAASPKEMPARVIVVDNSPSKYLAEQTVLLPFPQIQYIASPENLGFAGGVNLGLTAAEGRFIILLNPDAHPEPGCLPGLAAILAARPGAAVAGPKLIPFNHAESFCPSAAWRDPSLLTALVEYTPCRRFFNDRWLWRHYWINPATTMRMKSCAMVQGACFVIKRSWLEQVGSFDSERFFLYFEETDFCRRIRLKGGSVLYCPEYICRHQGGASLKGRRQDTARFWKSLYRFYAKHYGPVYTLLTKLALTVGLSSEYLLCLWKQRIRRSNPDLELDEYLKIVAERLHCHLGDRFYGA